MRITVELLQQLAEQRVNPCQERELVLRGLGLPVLEHLGAAPSELRALDLSHNHLQRLDNFSPRLHNITTLHATHNQISSLDARNVQRHLPQLQELTLCHNNIKAPQFIWQLAQATVGTLEFLSLQNNPICTQQPFYRLLVIHAFEQAAQDRQRRQEESNKQQQTAGAKKAPSQQQPIKVLRILDYQRIRPAERKRAQKWANSAAGRALLDGIQDDTTTNSHNKTFTPGENLPPLMDDDDDDATASAAELSAAQKDLLRQILQNAESEAEMHEIQQAIARHQQQQRGRAGTKAEEEALTDILKQFQDKQQGGTKRPAEDETNGDNDTKRARVEG